MKPTLNNITLALGIILMGTLVSGTAFAACGDHGKPGASLVPQSWDGLSGSLLPISDNSASDPIVGMWHVTFTAEGNEAGPPDGTPLDNALVVWHNDGT